MRRLLDVIGVALPDGPLGIAQQNVSPPAAVIEAARHIKAALMAQGMRAPDVAPLLARFMARASDRAQAGAAQEILSPEARRDLLARCAASNAALARDFLGGRDPFEAPKAEAEDWVPLAERAVAILSTHVVQEMRAALPEPRPDGVRVRRWLGARRRKT